MREFLDGVNESGKNHPKCGQPQEWHGDSSITGSQTEQKGEILQTPALAGLCVLTVDTV